MVYFSACKNRSICLAPQKQSRQSLAATQEKRKSIRQTVRPGQLALASEGVSTITSPTLSGLRGGRQSKCPPSISHDESHVSVSFGIDVSPARSTSLVHGVDSTIPSTALAGSVYL
jgi:hypothetical protein